MIWGFVRAEQKYKTIQEAEKKELLFLTKIVRFLAIQIGFYSETFQFRSVIDKDTLLTCNLTEFFFQIYLITEKWECWNVLGKLVFYGFFN